jgi:hypothetical protein
MALKALNFLARLESTEDLCFPVKQVGNKGNMGDGEESVGTQHQQKSQIRVANYYGRIYLKVPTEPFSSSMVGLKLVPFWSDILFNVIYYILYL